MKAKLAKLTSFLACFCGRYEYRQMHSLLEDINADKDTAKNLENLKACLENFQCTSTLEIAQRKEALSMISELLTENNHDVQPSETPATDPGTENPGNTEAQNDASGVDENQVNQPVPEEPAAEAHAEEQPAEAPVEEAPAEEQPAEPAAEAHAEEPAAEAHAEEAQAPAKPKRGRK